ncbi:helix-turn-helix transcriptional regulator [Bacillus velezensis]|nr:transcriptional regulator [Bacillus velezensis]QEQ06457.1 helix-turn-helix transcriptional regulator [Bacillus velezensis]
MLTETNSCINIKNNETNSLQGGADLKKNSSALTELLQKARKERELTHQDVVDRSGAPITRQYYGLIERGERQPSPSVAMKIAPVLGLPWTIFFDFDVNHRLHSLDTA